METLAKEPFGEQCADFITGGEPFLDCYDDFELLFTLEKLDTKVIEAPIGKRNTKLETILTKKTTRKDIKVDEHIPKEIVGSTWFRIFWDKTTNLKDEDWNDN